MISQSFARIRSFREGGSTHSKITESIVYFICKDNLPYSTVEGSGFRKLMKTAFPLYNVPSRNTIKKRILEKFDLLAEKVIEELRTVKDITLTSDIWTDTMSMKSFLGITVHFLKGIHLFSLNLDVIELSESHTGEYLANILRDAFMKWGIDSERVIAIVTDNDAKMLKAVKLLLGANKHINCFAHTINLTVENALNSSNAPTIIDKVREIVKFFKRSTTASDEMRRAQLSKDVKEGNMKKLILDVRTRWNSSFYMIDRFLDLLPIINDILLTKPTAPPMLSALEVESLKEITYLLKIFEKVTVEISGENYVTLSKIIPLSHCISATLVAAEPNHDSGKTLKTALITEMKKRFGEIEHSHLLSLSTVLDPRFKTIHHVDSLAVARTIRHLNNLIKDNQSSIVVDEQEQSSIPEKQKTDLDLWSLHNTLAHDKNVKKRKLDISDASFEAEVSLYLNHDISQLKENPLQVWEETKSLFPSLYPLARKYLSPVGTSVPSERLFSKAGDVITKKRNRLSGKALPKLLLLGSLPDEYWNY